MNEEEKMQREMSYFFDTSVMFEIVNGNEKFETISDNELFTSLFNLYELYFILLKDFNETIAQEFFYQFKKRSIPIKDEHIFTATLFRKENSKRRFSYADCLGYVIALDIGIKFLTYDRAFQGVENVELIT